MRHLLLPALALPLITGASPAPDKPAQRPGTSDLACPGVALVKEGSKPEVRRLGDLPSGSLVLSVLLKENGCPKPVIVRDGFGEVDGRTGANFVPERGSARR